MLTMPLCAVIYKSSFRYVSATITAGEVVTGGVLGQFGIFLYISLQPVTPLSFLNCRVWDRVCYQSRSLHPIVPCFPQSGSTPGRLLRPARLLCLQPPLLSTAPSCIQQRWGQWSGLAAAWHRSTRYRWAAGTRPGWRGRGWRWRRLPVCRRSGLQRMPDDIARIVLNLLEIRRQSYRKTTQRYAVVPKITSTTQGNIANIRLLFFLCIPTSDIRNVTTSTILKMKSGAKKISQELMILPMAFLASAAHVR